MAIRLQLQNDFENSGLYGAGGSENIEDLNDIIFDRQDYTATYPGLRSFTTQYGVPFGGMTVGDPTTAFMIDVTHEQIFMIRGGAMKIIAGMYGFTGLRNGTGSQALFGLGGFQESFGVCVDSTGALYVTDSKNGKIRKLVEELDGTWTVSTYANYNAVALSCDPSDNIWTRSGSDLIKITGGPTTYATGINNINQIVCLANGHILIVTRDNSWDPIYDFDPATEIVVRLAGLKEAEVTAYRDAHGFVLVDGPALGGATFHSPQFAYYNSDGSEVWMGGGDERQLRRYLLSSGRVDSLFPDGTFQETQIRIGSDTGGNPDFPLFLVSPGGKQVNGYPAWDFGRPGGITAALKVVAVDIGVPGLTDNASFVSQSVPTTMDGGQPYSVTVTMRNNGTSTWTPSTFFRLGSQNPQDNITWNFPIGGTRVAITSDVPPNTNYAFTFTVTAPSVAGSYNFQSRMVHDGVTWFGAFSPNVVVTVAGASPPTGIPVTLNLKL